MSQETARTVVDTDKAKAIVMSLMGMCQGPREAVATLCVAIIVVDVMNAEISGKQPRTMQQLIEEVVQIMGSIQPEGRMN
jgi:hypothetical protein